MTAGSEANIVAVRIASEGNASIEMSVSRTWVQERLDVLQRRHPDRKTRNGGTSATIVNPSTLIRRTMSPGQATTAIRIPISWRAAIRIVEHTVYANARQ